MASERFSEIRALVAVDMHVQSFLEAPDVETVILRPAHNRSCSKCPEQLFEIVSTLDGGWF